MLTVIDNDDDVDNIEDVQDIDETSDVDDNDDNNDDDNVLTITEQKAQVKKSSIVDPILRLDNDNDNNNNNNVFSYFLYPDFGVNFAYKLDDWTRDDTKSMLQKVGLDKETVDNKLEDVSILLDLFGVDVDKDFLEDPNAYLIIYPDFNHNLFHWLLNVRAFIYYRQHNNPRFDMDFNLEPNNPIFRIYPGPPNILTNSQYNFKIVKRQPTYSEWALKHLFNVLTSANKDGGMLNRYLKQIGDNLYLLTNFPINDDDNKTRPSVKGDDDDDDDDDDNNNNNNDDKLTTVDYYCDDSQDLWEYHYSIGSFGNFKRCYPKKSEQRLSMSTPTLTSASTSTIRQRLAELLDKELILKNRLDKLTQLAKQNDEYSGHFLKKLQQENKAMDYIVKSQTSKFDNLNKLYKQKLDYINENFKH